MTSSRFDFNSAGPGDRRTTLSDDEPAAPPNLRTLQRRHGGELYKGGRRLLMPGPGHGPRDRSLSIKVAPNGRLLFHSFAGDRIADIRDFLGLEASEGERLSPREAAKEREDWRREEAAVRARKLAFCQSVWSATVPTSGSPVDVYLACRAITAPVPDVIRYHPMAPLNYERTATAPAMVALVTGADGAMSGLHITAIRPDGSGKALGDKSRRMLGEMRGGAVRLAPISASGELAACEGIETGLAYAQITGEGVWAALSTFGLRSFDVPPGLKRLTIAADNDKAGLEAAQSLMERAKRRCACAVVAPTQPGRDFNDVLKDGAQ